MYKHAAAIEKEIRERVVTLSNKSDAEIFGDGVLSSLVRAVSEQIAEINNYADRAMGAAYGSGGR